MHFGRSESHRTLRWMLAVVAAALGAMAAVPSVDPESAAPHPLVWDAMERVITPAPGESSAGFQFDVTNVSDGPVTIEQIRPTCGCTVAEMPSSPWVIAAHGRGSFFGTIEFRGKEGEFSKAIFVNSTAGTQMLRVTVKIPVIDAVTRRRNQELAKADRQAVFHGDCAKCHAAPAEGLTGSQLFIAACGVCHLTDRRAEMVPDLLVARQPRNAEYWRKWIREGKDGTLMPAWAKERGGPLTPEQIESLVEFAVRTLPTEPRPPELAAPGSP